jgi:hypothetical protein
MEYAPTAPNSTVYTSPPVGGSDSATALVSLHSIPTPHSGTFGRHWSLLRKAIILAAKMSYTTGTLYVIRLDNIVKIIIT